MTEEGRNFGKRRGKCSKCGFQYEQHSIVSYEELAFLRSLGYGAFICRDMEDNPLLKTYVEIVAMNPEHEFLSTREIEEMYKNREPNDPCDGDYMEEISS